MTMWIDKGQIDMWNLDNVTCVACTMNFPFYDWKETGEISWPYGSGLQRYSNGYHIWWWVNAFNI